MEADILIQGYMIPIVFLAFFMLLLMVKRSTDSGRIFKVNAQSRLISDIMNSTGGSVDKSRLQDYGYLIIERDCSTFTRAIRNLDGNYNLTYDMEMTVTYMGIEKSRVYKRYVGCNLPEVFENSEYGRTMRNDMISEIAKELFLTMGKNHTLNGI